MGKFVLPIFDSTLSVHSSESTGRVFDVELKQIVPNPLKKYLPTITCSLTTLELF